MPKISDVEGIKVIKLKRGEDIEKVMDIIEEVVKPRHSLDKEGRDIFLTIINNACDRFNDALPEYEPDFEDEVSLTAINSLYKHLPRLRGVLASVVSPLLICLAHDKPWIFNEFAQGVDVLSRSIGDIIGEVIEKDIREEEVI